MLTGGAAASARRADAARAVLRVEAARLSAEGERCWAVRVAGPTGAGGEGRGAWAKCGAALGCGVEVRGFTG